MSELIAQAKAAPAPIITPTKLDVPKFETCGTCVHAQVNPQDLNMIMCFGAPPTPQIIGMQQTPAGPSPVVTCIRPTLPRKERACGTWARGKPLIMKG